MGKLIKVKELDGKKVADKEEGTLKGNIVALNPEKSEIAKRLKISEKGFYSVKG